MRRCLLSIASLLLLTTSTAHAALQATLDRQQGAVGAPFLLTLEATENDSRSPDLTPLESDFAILGSRHSALSSFKNGRSQIIQRWLITLSPRQSGRLQIPPLGLGDERSQPLVFEALGGSALAPQRDLALETSLDLPIAYQRSAVVLSVRLFYRDRLQHAEITEPLLPGVLIYPLGAQRNFKEQRHNQVFNVIEQRYALIAEGPGRLRIPALEFSGIDAAGNALSARSNALDFEALPWPASARGASVAATELRISERWEPDRESVQAGDTLQRTLVIEAHNLPAAWLPSPELAWPAGLSVTPLAESREERIDNGVLVSTLRLPFRLLFTGSGTLTLAPVSLRWWDAVRERSELTQLPGRSWQVRSFLSPEGAMPAPAPSAATRTEPATSAKAKAAATGADKGADNGAGSWLGWLWAAVALVCGAGWTLARARTRQLEHQLRHAEQQLQSQSVDQQVDRTRQQEQEAFARLEQSCRYAEPEQAYHALLHWARCFWPERAISGLKDLEQAAAAPTLTYLLRNLDHRLRHPEDDEPWPGDLTLEQIARLRRKRGVVDARAP